MKTIYDDADRYLKILKDDLRRVFNGMSVRNFDELSYPQIREVVKSAYDGMLAKNLDLYLRACRSAVDFARKKCKHGAHWHPDMEWLEKSLRKYNPVTKYLFFPEADRKRLRETEAILTMVSFMDPVGLRQSIRSGATAWWRQTSQGMIDSVDDAVIEEYKRSGVKKVKWITEEDDRVCAECAERHGHVYDLDEVPEKPHYNCRCTLEPVEED